MQSQEKYTSPMRGVIMKKSFFLLVVFLFIAGCSPSAFEVGKSTPEPVLAIPSKTAIPAATLYPTRTPTPADPNILFSDDFTNMNSGWWQTEDSQAMLNYDLGTYQISGTNTDFINWSVYDKSFDNGVFTVNVKRLSGSYADSSVVLFWRVSVDGNSYYSLSVDGLGNYQAGKQIAGEYSPLSTIDGSSYWNTNDLINKVTISFNENNADIFFNDHYEMSFQDSSLEYGNLALGAFGVESRYYKYAFDNLFVYKYDPSNAYTPIKPTFDAALQPTATSTRAPSSQAAGQNPAPTAQPTASNLVLDITIKVVNQCSVSHTVIFTGPSRLKYVVEPGATMEWQGARGNYSWTIDGIPGEQSPMDLFVSVWTLTLCY